MKLSEVYAEHGDEPPAIHVMQREIVDPDVVAHFVIDGDPQVKGRPRFTRTGRVYTPKETRRAEDIAAWHFRQAMPGWVPNKEDTYGVVAIFFCQDRHRRDVDNMLKLVLDGLNGVAWVDDMQVTEVSGRLIRGVTDPRTDIVIYRTLAMPKPTRPCLHCGTPFEDYPSQRGKRQFCTKACGYEWRKAQRTRVCAHCSRDYQVHSAATAGKYCSVDCKTAAGRITLICDHCHLPYTPQRSIAARSKRNACSAPFRAAMASTVRMENAKGTCARCGGPTSKKTYTHCAACMQLARPSKLKEA